VLDRRKRPLDDSGVAYVGRTYVPKRSGEKTFEHARKHFDIFPELKAYKMPSQRPHDELFVLKELASAIRSETPEGLEYLKMAQRIVTPVTPKGLQPAWFSDGYPRVDDVLNVISKQNRGKHPGFPACLLGVTKGIVIDRFLPELVQAILARMICLNRLGRFCVTPEDFYNCYCNDFSSFSLKTEVIKVTKFGRGLAAMAIVGSCVEKLFADTFGKEFKNCAFEFYSAIGIGFTAKDSALLHAASLKPAFRSDVPTFDWTVTLDENLLNVETEMDSLGVEQDSQVRRMAVAHERATAAAAFILSNGWVFILLVLAVVRTGRDLTSIFNTMTRARRSYAVDLKIALEGGDIESLPLCAGDDANEGPHEHKVFTYASLGFPLRDAHVSEDVDFCSHDWPEGRPPVGQRIFKSLFNLLLNEDVTYEQFEAFCREFKDHADFPAVIDRIFVARPKMKLILDKMISNVVLDQFGTPSYTPFARFKSVKGTKYVTVQGVNQKKRKRVVRPRKPVVLANNAAPTMRVPRAPRVSRQKGSSDHVKAICSITDPFCPASKGKKWPDGTMGNTLTEQFRGNNTIGTNAAGYALSAFAPGAPFGFIFSSTAGSGPLTMGATFNQYGGSSMLGTYGYEVRIVSFGLVVRAIASATTAAGLVTFGTSATPPLVSTAYSLGTELYTESMCKALTPGMEMSWISQPLGPDSREFKAKSTASVVTNLDWTSLFIEVSGGAASANVLNVEWYLNVEFTVGAASGLASVASVNPPKSGIAESSVAQVHSSLGSFIEGGVASVEQAIFKSASSALDKVIKDPMGSLSALMALL